MHTWPLPSSMHSRKVAAVASGAVAITAASTTAHSAPIATRPVTLGGVDYLARLDIACRPTGSVPAVEQVVARAAA